MTREEAIERLNCLNNKCDPYECIDVKCYKCDEAVEMAIEDLQQEPEEDCISKALTLEILNAMANVDKDNIKVYSKVYSQIKDMPKVKRKFGKWIPVSERLPEIGKVVLITCPFTICLSEHGNRLVTFDQWNGKEWIRFDGYVSAWQPLPEPYEEAEQ